MKRYCSLLSCGIAAFVAVLGCGDGKDQNAVVQGTVTIDGELAQQGAVTFHSQGGGPVAYGTIHPDGSFAMRIGQGRVSNLDQSEIYPGDYTATVVVNAPSTPDPAEGEGAPPIPGMKITAAKYGNKATSELQYSIRPGLNVIHIPVERATAEELELQANDAEEATTEEATTEEVTTQTESGEPEVSDASEVETSQQPAEQEAESEAKQP